MIHEEKTQTTCVLRLFGVPLWAVQQAAQQADIAARCRGRGAEVLAALQAETPAGLEKARKALCGRFAAEPRKKEEKQPAETAVPMPNIPEMDVMWTVVGNLLTDVNLSKSGVDKAFAAALTQANSLIDAMH